MMRITTTSVTDIAMIKANNSEMNKKTYGLVFILQKCFGIKQMFP